LVVYFSKWETVEYNTKETWDELFKKRYPSIYNKLMSEYLAKYSY
jgi:hypothetical protein